MRPHSSALGVLTTLILPEAILAAILTPQSQVSFQANKPKTTLHGRFLHITDIHPDSHYQEFSSIQRACHGKKLKKKKKNRSDRAAYWGSSFTECDAPWRLTNWTIDYLERNWADKIDFVVWTGDNARHDTDSNIPRTLTEIYESNRILSHLMKNAFLDKGIPVVPSLGNNDVWPHNIMFPGPTAITNTFASIWQNFIPFASTQIFRRGAYYSKEVIPGSLAVVALNTMYFYDSNKAVDGCKPQAPIDPGNLQFDWLDVQLEGFRQRNMQVWLTGHVPPSAKNYFSDCYIRYLELSLRYQDTIVGHLYGHLNVDHFTLLSSKELEISSTSAKAHKKLYNRLIEQFGEIPERQKKTDLNTFGIVNVSPANVPSPYESTFRIYTYNATYPDSADLPRPPPIEAPHQIANRKKCRSDDYSKTWKCLLDEPWFSNPDAPSRTNRLWSPLGYAQYFLPNLDSKKSDQEPKVKLEYLTYPIELLHERNKTDPIIPPALLPAQLRDESVNSSKYAPYGLDDLTIRSWIDFARTLASPKSKKLQRRFYWNMYMGGEEE